MGFRRYAAPFRRSRLVRSLGVAAAALALGGLPPSRGNGAEPPAAQTGADEAKARAEAQARAETQARVEAQARAASRECLTRATGTMPASRFECDLVLSPELARLSVLYGADGWSGARVLSWQELHEVPLFPRLERGFGEPETGLDWRDFQDAESRMRLEGKKSGLRYKAEYGFFQDGFYKKGGFFKRASALTSVHSGGRFEAAWKLGFVEPKLDVGRSWRVNQQQEFRTDGDGDEEARTKARFALAFPVPHLPLLTLSAGRVSRALTPSEHHLADPEAKQVLTDVLSASLWHGGERWQASVTSSYFEIARVERKATEAVMQDHVVTFSYRPTDTLSLEPIVEYMETTYAGLDYGTTSSLAALGIYHSALDKKLRTFVYASYYTNRDSGEYGGYMDTRSTDLAVGLEHDISRFLGLPHGRQSVGLQFSGGYYDDLMYPDASLFTYGAFVQIRIQP